MYYTLNSNDPLTIPCGTFKPLSSLSGKPTIKLIDESWVITGWSEDKSTIYVNSSLRYNAVIAVSQYSEDTYFIENRALGLLLFDNNCYSIEVTKGGFNFFASLIETKENPARIQDSSQRDQLNSTRLCN